MRLVLLLPRTLRTPISFAPLNGLRSGQIYKIYDRKN